jgi:hypothetical protein
MAVETPKRKEVAHDEAPAIISDHAYVPRDEWWSLCRVCGLAQAAHAEVSEEAREAERKAHIAYYGDDNPEVFE